MLNSGDQPSPRRFPQPSSRKGCMRGKGGPENASCWFKGVRQRTWGKWVAEIREPNHGARLWLGTFEDSESAAIAYDKAARRIYGLEAEVNFPDRLSSINPTAATVTTDQVSNIGNTISHREIQIPESSGAVQMSETGFIQIPDTGIEMQLQLITPRDECYSSWYDFCSTNQFILHDKKQEYYDENGLSEFGGSSSCRCIDKVDELCLSTATDGITNNKKSLKVDHLPEVDDSSLWADAIATTDFQKMIDSEFLAVGVEDMALQNKVIDTFWLNKDA